jgi:hypothetical protein
MKRVYYFFLLLFLFPVTSFAQSEVSRLNGLMKNPYITTEEIDAIVPQLYKISVNNLDSFELRELFETYKLAADRYAGNNHFKQAYLVFGDYLDLKEKILAKEKAMLIAKAIDLNGSKQQQMEAETKTLKSDINLLNTKIYNLQSRNNNFIRNAALVIILFAAIFVLIFLRITMRLKRIREELIQYRKQLLSLEKTALIGRLNEQIAKSSYKNLEAARSELASLERLISQLEAGIAKEQIQTFNKIKDQFKKAESDLQVLIKGNYSAAT